MLIVIAIGWGLSFTLMSKEHHVIPGGSTHFPEEREIRIDLLDDEPRQRLDACLILLKRLGEARDIDTKRALDGGIIRVNVAIGVNEDEWIVPFQVVWPSPLSATPLTIVNRSAIFKWDLLLANQARTIALDRIEDEIASALTEDSLGSRIEMANGPR